MIELGSIPVLQTLPSSSVRAYKQATGSNPVEAVRLRRQTGNGTALEKLH